MKRKKSVEKQIKYNLMVLKVLKELSKREHNIITITQNINGIMVV